MTAIFLLNQKKSFAIIKSPDLTKKGRTYYIIYYNYFKDTNFDFDRFKYRSKGLTIYVDAYYIADDEICPICGSNSICKNGHITKTVKHCTYHTMLFLVTCHIQRYKCKYCNFVFYEKDTFSNHKETLSKETIFIILEKLKLSNITFESVARDLHISRQNVIDVFDRYIDYNPGKLPEILSFDEKHINKRMTENVYIFIIVDFKNIQIYDIVSSRHKFVLERYFSKISPEERQKVQYITIDMWETYLDVAKRYFRNAKIAIDSFHIMETINNAMNSVRISVMQRFNLKTDNIEDNHPYYYVLKKYRYYFVSEFDHITDKRFYNRKMKIWFDKHSMRKYLLDIDFRLEKAYNLTSRYREFNKTTSYEKAEEELEILINDFYTSNLSSFFDVAKTLSTWKEYIINSFITISDALSKPSSKGEEPKPRRLSSGAIEGLNATLEKINVNGNGYSNFWRFRNRSIYVINKNIPILNTPKQRLKIDR
ncbi:MAG: transposase [Bacilli bacterium]